MSWSICVLYVRPWGPAGEMLQARAATAYACARLAQGKCQEEVCPFCVSPGACTLQPTHTPRGPRPRGRVCTAARTGVARRAAPGAAVRFFATRPAPPTHRTQPRDALIIIPTDGQRHTRRARAHKRAKLNDRPPDTARQTRSDAPRSHGRARVGRGRDPCDRKGSTPSASPRLRERPELVVLRAGRDLV